MEHLKQLATREHLVSSRISLTFYLTVEASLRSPIWVELIAKEGTISSSLQWVKLWIDMSRSYLKLPNWGRYRSRTSEGRFRCKMTSTSSKPNRNHSWRQDFTLNCYSKWKSPKRRETKWRLQARSSIIRMEDLASQRSNRKQWTYDKMRNKK